MSLIETLISNVPKSDMTVERIVRGPRHSMVVSSHCGIGATPDGGGGANRIPPAAFTGRPLSSLFELALSPDHLEAGLGMAAVNAAIAAAFDTSRFRPSAMARAGGKSVGLLGDLPFAAQLKDLAHEVILIEPDDAERVLPRVDIAIFAGAQIVEHRLERLLKISASAYTVVYGPSTPLSPVLFDYGADQLVGVMIANRETAADCVAAGMSNLMECTGLKPVVLKK